MSKKHFSILLVITVVVALAVVLVPSRTGRDAPAESTTFLPELAAEVNDVVQLRVSAEGGSEVVTLNRQDQGWVVSEAFDYPADWSVIRPLLAGLSQAEVVEEKTSNPDYYHRLGLEDPESEDATSKLVEFPLNESLPSVIVGNSAQGREGQYLRRQGEARSVLVDQSISLPLDSSGWLAREIVDLPESEVLALRIVHPDGETVAIQRNSTEVTDFTLEDIPEGRKTKSAWTINQLASGLAGLQLEAVAPLDDVSWEGAIKVQAVSDSGLQVDALLAEDEEHRWVRLEASGSEAAEAINQRVAGWAYQIPLYKYDAFNKGMADLLAEPEDEGD